MLEAKHVASVQQCSQCVRQRRIKGYDDVLFGVIGMRAREEVSQSSAMFPLHPSPTEISKGRLTPSSRRRLRRHHRRLLCRRLHLPLRLLPRLALVEGRHRRLPTDHNGLSRGIPDVFCSYPMVRLKFFSQPEQRGRRTAGGGAA